MARFLTASDVVEMLDSESEDEFEGYIEENDNNNESDAEMEWFDNECTVIDENESDTSDSESSSSNTSDSESSSNHTLWIVLTSVLLLEVVLAPFSLAPLLFLQVVLLICQERLQWILCSYSLLLLY